MLDICTVIDANRCLCARAATWTARNGHAQEFSIIPLQSTAGAALMGHYGFVPTDPNSWRYIERERPIGHLVGMPDGSRFKRLRRSEIARARHVRITSDLLVIRERFDAILER